MQLVKQERHDRREPLRYYAYDNGFKVGYVEHYVHPCTILGAQSWGRAFRIVNRGWDHEAVQLGDLTGTLTERNQRGLDLIRAYREPRPVNPGLPSDAVGLPS
jgi:hypothetical protein